MNNEETFYQAMRRQGVTRRSFLKYCSLAATSLGLGAGMAPKIAWALENKPRIPVVWIHGLECTCCTESFIRSAHPLAKDVILSLISLDYDDTLMAAAGTQAAQSFAQSIPQPPAPEPVILPEQAPAFPGAFPATYPAGGAGAFPDVAHVAEAAGGTPGMPGNAAYAGVPGTVAFTAGAAQANQIPNANAVRARLIDVASNRSYDLATNRVLLGRETGNDIVVNDLNASRQHAQIEFEPQGVWVITDLGSTNGTLVNGAPVTRRGLSDGDRITLGITDFIFSLR